MWQACRLAGFADGGRGNFGFALREQVGFLSLPS
jgi:hypothetical protein